MLASVITLLIVVSTLVILVCNAGVTGFFLRPSPRGDGAMGLIVPFAGLVGGAAVLTLASLLTALRPGRPVLGLLHDSPLVSGVLVVAGTFGVVLAAFMAFAAWAEPLAAGSRLRVFVPVLCTAAGVVGPLLLAMALLAGAWMTPQGLASNPTWLMWLRALCWTLAGLAVTGYLVGGVVVSVPLMERYSQMRAADARVTPEERAMRERLRNTPIEQQLRERLDALPPDAPLSDVIVYFDAPAGAPKLNSACRTMLIERILAMPDLGRQLIDCTRKRDYCYPRAVAELVRSLPQDTLLQHQDAWSQAIASGINATAEAMTIRPSWLSETFDSKPEPLEHVRAFLAAAERLKGLEGAKRIDDALLTLASNARELTRNKAWEKLAKELKRSGYPVPPDDAPDSGPR